MNFIKLYNFKAKRVDDKLIICYGLLTYKRYIVPVEKINAITINQPFFARFAHTYSVDLVNVGMGNAKDQSAANLLLMCNKERMQELLLKLLPEFPADFPEAPRVQVRERLADRGRRVIAPVLRGQGQNPHWPDQRPARHRDPQERCRQRPAVAQHPDRRQRGIQAIGQQVAAGQQVIERQWVQRDQQPGEVLPLSRRVMVVHGVLPAAQRAPAPARRDCHKQSCL